LSPDLLALKKPRTTLIESSPAPPRPFSSFEQTPHLWPPTHPFLFSFGRAVLTAKPCELRSSLSSWPPPLLHCGGNARLVRFLAFAVGSRSRGKILGGNPRVSFLHLLGAAHLVFFIFPPSIAAHREGATLLFFSFFRKMGSGHVSFLMYLLCRVLCLVPRVERPRPSS